MCGRTRVSWTREEIMPILQKNLGMGMDSWRGGTEYSPSHNAGPGRSTPVAYVESDGKLVVRKMRWGLVPSYTKPSDKPDFFRMFNGRSETLGEKPVFKRLLKSHRCLVPIQGFYEWKKEGNKKQPYYVSNKDQLLVLAGLYDVWQSKDEGEVYTYTILTTKPVKKLNWLHNRMPVILKIQEEGKNSWLQENEKSADYSVFDVDENVDLQWHPVTNNIGKLSFDGPQCYQDVRTLIANEHKGSIKDLFGKGIIDEGTMQSGSNPPMKLEPLSLTSTDISTPEKEKTKSAHPSKISLSPSVTRKRVPDPPSPKKRSKQQKTITSFFS